jgi:zinc transport system ATP-binding protein
MGGAGQMPAGDSVVSVRGLTVVLGGKVVIGGIDLQVMKGTLLGIVGPNGGGKTTLLRAILGLVKPTRGSVLLFGVPPREARRRGKRVGYVPQRSRLQRDFPTTALDVALMGRYGVVGVGRRLRMPDRRAALESLRWVGMEDVADEPFSQLSGGQQKRVLVARALSLGPELLILDEPMSGVDVEGQDAFYRLLVNLKRELTLTVVLVSHDVSVIPAYCDEVACLDRTLFLHGKPTEEEIAVLFERVHGCEVELLMHGRVPHRVIRRHKEEPRG